MAESEERTTPRRSPEGPLKPVRTILRQEIAQAQEELERPAYGLAVSGVLAGIGVGASTLGIGIVLTLTDGALAPVTARILAANAYTIGFILVILAHTDLFTEYTTIAILPVLTGQARLRALARLWGLVYAGNMAGAALFAVLLAMLGPALGVVEREPLEKLARGFLAAPWDVMLLSAVLAGWLMGLLSWLVAAAQETISQIVFIWLVTGLIGLAHLHHSITSTLDVLAAMLMGADIPAGALLGMVAIATLGNALGGLVFAALIRFSLVLGRSEGSRVTRER